MIIKLTSVHHLSLSCDRQILTIDLRYMHHFLLMRRLTDWIGRIVSFRQSQCSGRQQMVGVAVIEAG